ncbi:hypothetical protein Vadar_011191 [Vaccinium darrowii]|uniref:Uncharacterized protein n=1 Tax=Vaccinium darrowii TaxID=229202 RepID=A0ACB7YUW2_9ERIC|nr:hypothetical protein Vadar_011191 [Vaccinium darrowii]
MEISVIGTSQAMLVNTESSVRRDLFGFCGKLSPQIFSRRSTICFGQSIRWGKRFPIRLALKAAAQSEAIVSDKVCGSTSTSRTGSKPIDGVRLYVGLPLDAVSDCNTINHERAITAGLKALKLLGVDGVELPIWWGIAEKEAMGKYEWSGYLKLAEMVQKAGEQYRGCLSLSVDDLPVLDGKSPIQVYGNFCESFKSSFSAFLGSTITGISIGLGPDGELRYPSHYHPSKNNQIRGVGEFQCYDENMLTNLKQHAEAFGNPLWGLSGPHDSPTYDQLPNSNSFVNENGGSWEAAYGDFFLSWYSNNLISHLDRLLSLASSTFSDYPVKIAGKVPLIHSWYKTRSHPSELTAGFYNTVNRDGYDKNSSVSGGPNAFGQIKRNLLDENEVVDLFTYQRMGADFFSPDHFHEGKMFDAIVERDVHNKQRFRNNPTFKIKAMRSNADKPQIAASREMFTTNFNDSK